MVYGYIRVSKEIQVTQGYSLDAQIDEIRNYCAYNKLSEPTIISDEGISGRSIKKRKGFQEILKLIDDKKITDLVVFSIARFGRNSLDQKMVIAKMIKNGVKFHSVKERIDTSTAAGKFYVDILGSLAELESEQTSERVKSVFSYKRKNNFRYSRPIYGFKAEEVSEDNKSFDRMVTDANGQLVPDKEEIQWVKQVFALHEEGKSLRGIATYLNQNGAKSKQNSRFYDVTVKNIISKKEVYQPYILSLG